MPFVLHRKFPRALSLIHDVRHQAQISLDQDIARLQIAVFRPLQQFGLLRGGEREGKGAGGRGDAENTECRTEEQCGSSGKQHDGILLSGWEMRSILLLLYFRTEEKMPAGWETETKRLGCMVLFDVTREYQELLKTTQTTEMR